MKIANCIYRHHCNCTPRGAATPHLLTTPISQYCVTTACRLGAAVATGHRPKHCSQPETLRLATSTVTKCLIAYAYSTAVATFVPRSRSTTTNVLRTNDGPGRRSGTRRRTLLAARKAPMDVYNEAAGGSPRHRTASVCSLAVYDKKTRTMIYGMLLLRRTTSRNRPDYTDQTKN